MTDIEMLHHIAKGDTSAYCILYTTYSAKVREFAFRLMGNEEDAADVAHAIFLKIWEERVRLTEVRSIRNYLFQLTKNAVLDEFRRHAVHLKYEAHEVAYFEDEEMDSQIYANDFQELIEMTVEMMPKERREVFRLSRNEGKTHKEIADQLGVSEKTVQYHIANALKELRKVMVAVVVMLFV